MVDGLILMMFLLFRTFEKTLHVATNTEETILDILYERVNKNIIIIIIIWQNPEKVYLKFKTLSHVCQTWEHIQFLKIDYKLGQFDLLTWRL